MPTISSSDALHQQILDAFENTLAALDLGGCEARIHQVVVITGTWAANAQYPCIVLAPAGVELIIDEMNDLDNIGFPVTVRVVDKIERSDRPGVFALWKERIRRAFHNKRLAGVAAVRRSISQPAPFVEEEPQKLDLLSMPCVFSVDTRQRRD